MIFCAGLGTRFQPFTLQHPKALAPIFGISLLQHNIQYLQRYGIYEVVVNVHHFPEQIEEAIFQNRGWGSEVLVSNERGVVLETGGGLYRAAQFLGKEDFLTLNVDILTDLNLHHFIDAHHAGAALATLAVTERSTSRNFLTNQEGQLMGWCNESDQVWRAAGDFHTQPYPYPSNFKKFAFSGITCFSNRVWETAPLQEWSTFSIDAIRRAFTKQDAHSGTEENNSNKPSLKFSTPQKFSTPPQKFSLVESFLYWASFEKISVFNHQGSRWIDVGRPASVPLAEQLFPELSPNFSLGK